MLPVRWSGARSRICNGNGCCNIRIQQPGQSQAKSAVLSKFQFLYPEGVPMSAGHHESLLNYTKVKVRSILCLMFYWPMGVTKKVEL